MITPNKPATDGSHWTLAELFARAGVRPAGERPLPSVTITSLTDDSRRVQRGGCYVAVRGSGVNGHDFIEAAFAAGARVVVAERGGPNPEGTVRVLVKDSRETLARLAAAYYGLRGGAGCPRLIGVTGTNGKTTVAWLVRAILTAAGYPTALFGTIEYDLVAQQLRAPLTTPGSMDLCRYLAAARDAGAEFAVAEVSSHALDQRRCDGLPFTAGVFMNLSGDHLDYHETTEQYGAAKRRLFDLLDADGTAVVNRDDPMGRSLIEELNAPVVSFGLETNNCDVRATIRVTGRWGSEYILHGRSFETPVRLALVGRHNVLNALAAAATAEALGITPDAIHSGLEGVTGVPGRLQRAEPQGCPFSIFVDYAHTDAALQNVLQSLRPLTAGKLICVFGCGGDRDRSKRPRMAAVVGRLADVAYVTSDNPRTEDPRRIIEEILPGFDTSPQCRVEIEADRRRAVEAAIAEAQPGDTVLIAGKGHETYQLIADKVLPFDDIQVARECLSAEYVMENVG
jgi:UDP-N-acetylmuramoyl-L-alanyl-D-glutamate--2,6-diaminopimelate ligase